jgi:hypothetical protein
MKKATALVIAAAFCALLSCNSPVQNAEGGASPSPSSGPSLGLTLRYDGNGNTGGSVPAPSGGHAHGFTNVTESTSVAPTSLCTPHGRRPRAASWSPTATSRRAT